MEESANRYFLVMFLRKETKIFLTENEAKDFILSYNNQNRDIKNPEVGGKLKTAHKSKLKTWIVSYSVYRKVTKKTSLETIDFNTTEKYQNENSLKTTYINDVRGQKGKLYVGYMDDGEVKLIPVLYIKDKLFGNFSDLSEFMISNIENREFMHAFWANSKLRDLIKYKKNSIFFMNKLREAYGEFWMGNDNLEEIKELITCFVKAWCAPDSKINQRLVRDLGSIVKASLKKANYKGEIKKENDKEIKLFR